MKPEEVCKIRDEVAHNIVLPEQHYPQDDLHSDESFVPALDSHGNLMMIGKLVKRESSLGKYTCYTPEFVAMQGLSVVMPHDNIFEAVAAIQSKLNSVGVKSVNEN